MREDFTSRGKRLVTRPRVISFLMSKGYSPEPVPNPFSPEMHAWEVPDTPETRKLIDGFLAALRAEREKEGRDRG